MLLSDSLNICITHLTFPTFSDEEYGLFLINQHSREEREEERDKMALRRHLRTLVSLFENSFILRVGISVVGVIA